MSVADVDPEIIKKVEELFDKLERESPANLERFLNEYPHITLDMLLQQLLFIEWVAEHYSEDPSTQTASANFTPEGALRSLGVNNMPEGIERVSEIFENNVLKKLVTGHAEKNSCIVVGSKDGPGLKDHYNVSKVYHCAPCLNDIHASGMSYAFSNRKSTSAGVMMRYADSFLASGLMLDKMINPKVAHIFLDIPAGVTLQFGVGALYELKQLITGIAFNPPITYTDLIAWGQGTPRLQPNIPILGVK
ncbi:MAG: hypothetical protein GC136_07330 [Alphaproteobacteria bacterium]|nr:hypothetical protein [Alphaproteobacteria bacterium]